MHTQEWLAKLVSFDTSSHKSNLYLINAIEEWLSSYNILSFKTFNTSKNKANLFATIPTKSGEMNQGLILSGHTDVVPVKDQHWASNPFVTLQKNDRIYGRGTADMKGFLAVILALVPTFIQSNLRFPLHLAFSYDEEIGCLGAPHMIADFNLRSIKPIACIVGEPTEMQAVISHKGIQIFQCQLYGKASHSSLTPQACNAIDYAADLICWMRQYANDLQNTGPFDKHFDIPFTTITSNIIKGGTANNIIPAYCEFFFEFRNLPNVDPNEIIKHIEQYIQNTLLPKMQNEYSDANILIHNMGSIPSFKTSASQVNLDILRHIIGNSNKKVSYATEAGLFERAGIPTIICGPGSIEQAHGSNEYISLSQLKACEEFLINIVT